VFQCLNHTVGLSAEKTQVLAQCHYRRNVAEHEGHLEIEEALLKELIQLTDELLTPVIFWGDYKTNRINNRLFN